jgi:hypothetical protein
MSFGSFQIITTAFSFFWLPENRNDATTIKYSLKFERDIFRLAISAIATGVGLLGAPKGQCFYTVFCFF